MLNSEILDLVIGMVFVYLLVALSCTALREGLESWLQTRSAFLEYAIRELLHDRDGTGLTTRLYNHPLIYGLFRGEYLPPKKASPGGGVTHPPMRTPKGSHLPSYIPAESVALALMDIAARGPKTDAVSSDPTSTRITVESMRANIANIENEPVQRVMLMAFDLAQDDLARVKASLASWYDSSMDRVTGWYSRSTRKILFWLGLSIAIALNVNTITIADYLYHDKAARTVLVAHAMRAAEDTTLAHATRAAEGKKLAHGTYARAWAELDSLGLPIGWSRGWGAPRPWAAVHGSARLAAVGSGFHPWNDLFGPILGWLVTALAAAMGAPFWFDLLSKISVVRGSVKPPEKSREEGSGDRGAPPGRALAFATGGGSGPTGGAPPAGVVPPAAGPAAGTPVAPLITPADEDAAVDACVTLAHEPQTPDEDLPPAAGGVAP